MKQLIEFILEWNRKLFPMLALILIGLVVIRVLLPNVSSRLLNLDYKVYFVAASGILYLIDYYRKRS